MWVSVQTGRIAAAFAITRSLLYNRSISKTAADGDRPESAAAPIAAVYKDAPAGALYWLGIITVLFFVAGWLPAAPCGSPFARAGKIIGRMALNE